MVNMLCWVTNMPQNYLLAHERCFLEFKYITYQQFAITRMFILETHFKEIQKSKRFIIMRLLFKNLLIEKSYSSTAACAAANEY